MNIDLDKNTHHHLTKELWDKIGRHHHHGIALPLFSLRSKKGCGVGEFLDLLQLVDFCTEVGLDVIQLLPLNDTGRESSPYNAISSCGLNPIFLSLWALPYLDNFPDLKLELVLFNKYKRLQKFPYNAIQHAKENFLRKYFENCFKFFEKDPIFLEFKEKQNWVKPYALFKVFKSRFAHKNWSQWQKKLINPSHRLLKRLYEEEDHNMNFYIFTQFLCHNQLKSVKTYANQKGVFLKGDIPILISPESLDVWLYREDFTLNYSAGSPPDMFSEEGQNWGFPLFQWDIVEKNEFSWWKSRLKTASDFYDIFRIDHIIGFYRIWAIKRGEKAVNGSYIPFQRWAAINQGEMILNHLVSATKMLPIGEDLGLEVGNIRQSMLKMGIPGTRVPRWERHFATDNSFIPYDEYPPVTLTTVSTHDSETLEQWWVNNPDDVKEFCDHRNWTYSPQLTKENRYNLLKDSHHTASLFHINPLGEYLALFPDLVWKNPNDERINLPGTMLPSNWSYRTRPTLEDIVNHKDLKSTMKSLIKPS